MIKISQAVNPEQMKIAKKLIISYSRSLRVSLDFQDFEAEMNDFPGQYSPPRGSVLLAYLGSEPAGCVALRPLTGSICEMKRLFVLPEYRGHSLGFSLAKAVISEAKGKGYDFMRLDTLPEMTTAQYMYEKLGFSEIPPYRKNPVQGSRFLELDLSVWP